MSQSALSEQAGASKAAISQYLSGKNTPGPDRIMVWKTENLEPLAYLIPAIFAELATATGFYYSKAKAENRIKLRKLYGPEIYNDAKEI